MPLGKGGWGKQDGRQVAKQRGGYLSWTFPSAWFHGDPLSLSHTTNLLEERRLTFCTPFSVSHCLWIAERGISFTRWLFNEGQFSRERHSYESFTANTHHMPDGCTSLVKEIWMKHEQCTPEKLPLEIDPRTENLNRPPKWCPPQDVQHTEPFWFCP